MNLSTISKMFSKREREESLLSFHNPLQLRKQPAFTSPLSARLFQPPNGRQGLRLATFFLPTDRGTAWARHAMHNLSSNLCNLRKTCSLRLFLRNAWRSREEGFLVTVPVAFRRSTRPIYTWLYAAGPK